MYATLQRPTPAASLRPPAPAAASRSGVDVLQAKLANAATVRALAAQARGLDGALAGRGVVQGFWPELAILGGLGGLGYWGYRKARERNPGETSAKRSALAERLHQKQRGSMVASLLDETEAMARRPDVRVTGICRQAIGRLSAGGGGYHLNVDPDTPIAGYANALQGDNEHLKRTARMHELTHVSVYEGYSGGNKKPDSVYPYNVVNLKNAAEIKALAEIPKTLKKLLNEDPVMLARPEAERNFLEKRVDYIDSQRMTETDTVINELVYYLHLKNIPATSEFSRKLVSLARERQNLRTPKFARKRK